MQIQQYDWNSDQKWNNKTCPFKRKNYCSCKKDHTWKPSTCTCENCKYLKSIFDISMSEYDEIVIVMGNVSTKMTNTRVTNVRVLVQ